jgi:hypothetical protein
MTHRLLLTAVLLLALALCGAGSAFAMETIRGSPPVEDFDPLPLIGMDPQAALAAFGPPREIFPLRGLVEAEDDVVFFYDESLYMFWYRNRVWQVRFDRRFERRVLGLTMGMSRTEVEQACPAPLLASGDSLYFDVEGCDCPVRARVVLDRDGVADIYVYRSDY